MTTVADVKLGTKGGGFLLEECDTSDIFTPENFSEEQKMIAQTVDEFMISEVLPQSERMESKDNSGDG